MRESPAIEIAEMLLENERYDVRIHDPHVTEEQVPFKLSSLEEAADGANLLVVLVDHNEFKQFDEALLLEKMATPVIFDTRNCAKIEDERFTVYQIGNLKNLKAIQA